MEIQASLWVILIGICIFPSHFSALQEGSFTDSSLLRVPPKILDDGFQGEDGEGAQGGPITRSSIQERLLLLLSAHQIVQMNRPHIWTCYQYCIVGLHVMPLKLLEGLYLCMEVL